MRRVYGKPWSRMVGQPIQIDMKTLRRLGAVLVKSVVEEAKKDFAKQGRVPRSGQPVGLPESPDFFKSFHYRITGESSVEVYSTWPFIRQVTEGREPYRMDWLTRQNGVHAVPLLTGNGELIFRVAPLSLGEAWIHPGFARHTFLERGIRKGREKMAEIVVAEAMKILTKGDPLK